MSLATRLSMRWRRFEEAQLLWVTGAVLVGTLVAVAWVHVRLEWLIGEASTLADHNTAWSFFQVESEFHALQDALKALPIDRPPAPQDLAHLRERYEIFVSRIPLIDPEQVHAQLPNTPEHLATLARLHAFTRRADAVLAEGAAPPRPEQLAALRDEAGVLTAPVHALTIVASQSNVARNEQRDKALREYQRLGLTLTALQTVVMLGFALLLFRQLRKASDRQAELGRWADRLEAARQSTELANQRKNAFLASLRQELKTPFAGVLSMLHQLASTPLDASQRSVLGSARESTEHLLALLCDLLDMSRTDQGQPALPSEVVDPFILVQSVQSLMRSAAQAKRLALDVELAPDVPRRVMADPTRLKQVLFNLVSNAISFTDKGQVLLRVSRAPARQHEAIVDERQWIEFQVLDTGAGLDATLRTRLFEQLDDASAEIMPTDSGQGLGLKISRSLARLIGGDIRAGRLPGHGSAFALQVPLIEVADDGPAARTPVAADMPAAPALPGMRPAWSMPPSVEVRRAAPAEMSPALDLKSLSELCALVTLAGVRPLLKGLLTDETRAYADLQAALAVRDDAALPTMAHRLKGAAQLLGCAALASEASAIEHHAGPWADADADAHSASLRRAWLETETLCRRLGFIDDQGRSP